MKVVDIRDGQRTYCTPDWAWHNRQSRPELVNIWLTESGRGQFSINGYEHPINAGDAFVLPLEADIRGQQDPSAPLTVTWAFIEVSSPPSHLRYQPPKLDFACDLALRALEVREKDRQRACAWGQLLLEYVLESPVTASVDPLDSALRDAAAEIRAQPENPLLLNKMAATCGLSVGHFSRRFKQRYGLTPRAWRTHWRLKAVQGLLQLSDLDLGSIARALGYSDPFHLSNQFRRHCGQSPSQWRKTQANYLAKRDEP